MSRIAVIVNLKIQLERRADFLHELREILNKVRQEPACVSIAGHEDPDDPTSVMLIEIWESREAFAEFDAGREYLREYMAKVKPWWSEPRKLQFWQTVA